MSDIDLNDKLLYQLPTAFSTRTKTDSVRLQHQNVKQNIIASAVRDMRL